MPKVIFYSCVDMKINILRHFLWPKSTFFFPLLILKKYNIPRVPKRTVGPGHNAYRLDGWLGPGGAWSWKRAPVGHWWAFLVARLCNPLQSVGAPPSHLVSDCAKLSQFSWKKIPSTVVRHAFQWIQVDTLAIMDFPCFQVPQTPPWQGTLLPSLQTSTWQVLGCRGLVPTGLYRGVRLITHRPAPW